MNKPGPEFYKFIRQHIPVVRSRLPKWFFVSEVQYQNNNANDNNATVDRNVKTTAKPKIPNKRLVALWKKLGPESKRRYYEMAEMDLLRYKQQRALWLSKIEDLYQKHEGSLEAVQREAPTLEELEREFLASFDADQGKYESMVQTLCTKTLYKKEIARLKSDTLMTDINRLLAAVPDQYMSLLRKPRQPNSAFFLYMKDNMERLCELHRDKQLKGPITKLAAQEWGTLDEATKQLYYDKFNILRDEYNKAMSEYQKNVVETDLITRATKERRAFIRELRKTYRDSQLLPHGLPNSFNLFVRDNKPDGDLKQISRVWHTLTDEKKAKYVDMKEAEGDRYYRDVTKYKEIIKNLDTRKSKVNEDVSEISIKNTNT